MNFFVCYTYSNHHLGTFDGCFDGPFLVRTKVRMNSKFGECEVSRNNSPIVSLLLLYDADCCLTKIDFYLEKKISKVLIYLRMSISHKVNSLQFFC